MKRIISIAIIIALVALVLCFAACSGKDMDNMTTAKDELTTAMDDMTTLMDEVTSALDEATTLGEKLEEGLSSALSGDDTTVSESAAAQ